ncbi:MAG: hypothetical protein ACT4TC_20370 [Myxococcaceae bacterium]
MSDPVSPSFGAPQALRYANAALSSAAHSAKLLEKSVPGVAVARGAVNGLRLFADVGEFQTDWALARKAPSADRSLQAAETASRGVSHHATFWRGVFELFKKRISPRLAPGANLIAAVADVAVATTTNAARKTSAAEKIAATVTAVCSAVAATQLPIVSSIAGLLGTGFSLWRDSENDRARVTAGSRLLNSDNRAQRGATKRYDRTASSSNAAAAARGPASRAE